MLWKPSQQPQNALRRVADKRPKDQPIAAVRAPHRRYNRNGSNGSGRVARLAVTHSPMPIALSGRESGRGSRSLAAEPVSLISEWFVRPDRWDDAMAATAALAGAVRA